MSHSSSSRDLSRDQPDLAPSSESFTYQQLTEKDTGPNDHSSANPDECNQSSVESKIDKEPQQSGLKMILLDLSSDNKK